MLLCEQGRGQTLPRPVVEAAVNTVKTIITDALIYAKQDFKQTVLDKLNSVTGIDLLGTPPGQ